MAELTLLPDVEQLLSAFLRDQPEVAAIVGERVYTTLPAAKEYPLVRLTRFGGSPSFSRPLWLDNAQVQFDCYGGPKKLANTLAETVRAAMATRLPGSHDDGYVSRVTFGALSYQPDDTLEPAHPRFIFTCAITAHPSRPTGS